MDASKIKIAFTSIFYPVFMGRYIWEALLRRNDVEVWAAGPFSDNWIPWGGGMKLPESYVRRPDLPFPFDGKTPILPIRYNDLEKACPFVPDLWLEVNAGLSAHYKPKGKYAVVGTDPHVLNYTTQRNQSHYFFCMQGPYMEYQDLWLPYAHDPIWHSKTEIPWDEREYDVALIGLHYENRTKLINRLIAEGLKVKYMLGPAYDDARKIYHNTRIGLNWSSKEDTTARVFEIMGFGIAPILNRVPDLANMFTEGKHYFGFSSEDEAVRTIQNMLTFKESSQAVAELANKAVQGHTWDIRVSQILAQTGLIKRGR